MTDREFPEVIITAEVPVPEGFELTPEEELWLKQRLSDAVIAHMAKGMEESLMEDLGDD